MATKYYGINDKWTDDDLENVIEVTSEDGTVGSVKVNGVEYGGGGSAICTLVFNNTTATQVQGITDMGYGDVSEVYDYAPGTIPDTVKSQTEIDIDGSGTTSIQIVATAETPALISLDLIAAPGLSFDLSGPITKLTDTDYNYNFVVSGSGTITIS